MLDLKFDELPNLVLSRRAVEAFARQPATHLVPHRIRNMQPPSTIARVGWRQVALSAAVATSTNADSDGGQNRPRKGWLLWQEELSIR